MKNEKDKRAELMGYRIKMARIEMKLSQQEFADKLKKDRVTVSRWETAEMMPEIPTLFKISGLTKKSISYYFGEDKIMQHSKLDELESKVLKVMESSEQDQKRIKELEDKLKQKA